MTRSLQVVRAGAFTTVQDAGRVGMAHLAVPRSGALDMPAYRLANRLVGNPEGAATLETTVTGVTFRVQQACHIAVTGGWAPVRVDGRPAAWGVPVGVRPRQCVDVGTATRGLRCYVAVSGGISAKPMLGSRSTDLLSGLGPAVLRDGDVLPLGNPVATPASIDMAPYPTPPDDLLLHLIPGPRDDWVTADSLTVLLSETYVVTPTSNRVGIRLDGPALRRRITKELPSEGVVIGAVQVPPDGRPIIFLADHPTTGGYPVIGIVQPDDLWRCAQARPGTPARFTRTRESASRFTTVAR